MFSSLIDYQTRLRAKDISAVEAVTACFDAIAGQKNLNVFVTLNTEQALQAAERADERLRSGQPRPLEGVPVAVKDNFCTEGLKTTAGSKILANFTPPYDATVIRKLRDAGAVIIGKTNMDEFAMGSSTESGFAGPAVNPVSAGLGLSARVAGGSSGGSAAAVAAGLVPAALGTDTGGSIRQPASFCGVTGFKPTYGVCSRWGIVAYGSSLDQAGAFARTVGDVALVMDAIAGEDPKDSTSAVDRAYDFTEALARPVKDLRIGFPKEVMTMASTGEADVVWKRARAIARDLGATCVEVSMPHFAYALPAYYIIALSEASSNLARYDGVRYGYRAPGADDILTLYERTRAEGFGEEVRRRILLGTYALSAGYYDAYYLKALKVRRIIADEFAAGFEQADVLFMPTAPSSAFEIGAHSADPVAMYLQDIYTVPVNMAGLPAISTPVATGNDGMPLGLQVIGPQFGDGQVLRVAKAVEEACSG